MTPEPADDQELLRRLKGGDGAALQALIERHAATVHGVALRITGNPEDAEEVLQDVFWTVVQKGGSFRGAARFSTWLYRVTHNAALMKLRRRPKVRPLPLAEELGPKMAREGMIAVEVPDWSHLPDQELHHKEMAGRLEEAIQKLPPEYRSVFVLRDVEGLSTEETCRVLQLSVPALKSRLHRARLFLRKALADLASFQGVPAREIEVGSEETLKP